MVGMKVGGRGVVAACLLVSAATGKLKGEDVMWPSTSETQPYQLWEAIQIHDTLNVWQDQYPNLIRVTSSQERYGLSRAGTVEDCTFEVNATGCSNAFFTIQDFATHPENSESSQRLPEIFWSGAIHGDERLGPTAVMELTSLLLESASCESKPNMDEPTSSWAQEIKNARECRNNLRERGIDDERRKWLARLVSTRRIVVVPTANALGFDRNEKTEGTFDPDQDFPYLYDGENKLISCMQTIAARTINEIFLEHMFQVALSFHSGPRNIIGFSWGAKQWGDQLSSPDVKAQSSLAKAREFPSTGDFSDIVDIGELNKIAKASSHTGIFEDWAYASSWDGRGLHACTPASFGGYPSERSSYNNSTHRAIALSVSTNLDTSSADIELGSSMDLFQPHADHLPLIQTMRLALASVDSVEPYVSVVTVGTTLLEDDVVPLKVRWGNECKESKAVSVPISMEDRLLIEWTVGGGFRFSHVEMWYALWKDLSENELDCLLQPSIDIRNDPRFTRGYPVKDEAVTLRNGTGTFSRVGPNPLPEDSQTGAGKRMGPIFRASIDISNYQEGDKIVVVAGAQVDQNWAGPPNNYTYAPRVNPQSHLLNARTNLNWTHELENGKKIQGRLDWYSIPVTIVLANYDHRIGTMELNNRFHRDVDTGHEKKSRDESSPAKYFGKALGLLLLIIVVFSCYAIYRRVIWLKKIEQCKATHFTKRPPCGIDNEQVNLGLSNSGGFENDLNIIPSRGTIEFEDMQSPSCNRDGATRHYSQYDCAQDLELEEIQAQTKFHRDPLCILEDDYDSILATESRDDNDKAYIVTESVDSEEEVVDFREDPIPSQTQHASVVPMPLFKDHSLIFSDNQEDEESYWGAHGYMA